MKTTMKKLTAGTFIALLLLVGNVRADGTELRASSLENIETTMQLENWMTSETIWNTNSIANSEFVQETETSLEIENWMTSEATWNGSQSFVEETEAGMQLESWMTNENIWDLKEMNTEEKLKVEAWMVNNKVWK